MNVKDVKDAKDEKDVDENKDEEGFVEGKLTVEDEGVGE